MSPTFELVQCIYPLSSSSCVYSFGSYCVDKQTTRKHTNKQMPLKTSNTLRYATTLDKQNGQLIAALLPRQHSCRSKQNSWHAINRECQEVLSLSWNPVFSTFLSGDCAGWESDFVSELVWREASAERQTCLTENIWQQLATNCSLKYPLHSSFLWWMPKCPLCCMKYIHRSQFQISS